MILRDVLLGTSSLLLFACGGDANPIPDASSDGTTADVTTQDVTTPDTGSDASNDVNADAPNDAASDASSDGGLAALCVSTGGTVGSGLCCLSSQDFPDTCTTGACGCSPNNSHTVQTCQCPNKKCFTQQQGCH